MADRDEFERRLLALVREYVDDTEEEYPDGFEIEEFMVLYQIRVGPPSDWELRPWHGGDHPGSWRELGISTSHGSWWMDEAMLNEAASRVRRSRSFAHESDDDANEEEDPDDA